MVNKSSENGTKFRYLGRTITNQNLIQEVTKSSMDSWNASHYSVQNLFTSHLLPENIQIKKNVVLPTVLYRRETRSFILKGEFESIVLRRMLVSIMEEEIGKVKN
jgi:hypothetical protein